MDGVKLSEIKGLMLDKKLEAYDGDLSSEYWNKAITEQGRRSIGLDREKLAEQLLKLVSNLQWNDLPKESQNHFLSNADAIIANEKELIVFKENNGNS